MSVDWTRPIQTRDGRKARYMGRMECKGDCILVAVRNSDSSEEYATTRAESGAYMSDQKKENAGDIINSPPPKVTVEVTPCFRNVYRREDGTTWMGGQYRERETAFANVQREYEWLGTWQLPTTIEVVKP
jgi:hypothetical protein